MCRQCGCGNNYSRHYCRSSRSAMGTVNDLMMIMIMKPCWRWSRVAKLRISGSCAAVLPPMRQFCCLPCAALSQKCAEAFRRNAVVALLAYFAPVRFLCVVPCFDWKFTSLITATVNFFRCSCIFSPKMRSEHLALGIAIPGLMQPPSATRGCVPDDLANTTDRIYEAVGAGE